MQIRSIQYLRGAAAMGVVCFHLYITELKSTAGHGVLPGWFTIGEAGVDLFFVISGFIMVFIQPLPLDNLSAYLRFLAHRVTRIYPPYWAVTLPLFLLWLVRPGLFNNYYHNHVDLWRSFLLLPQDYTPLLQVGWTLIHEVYFYLVVSVALLLGMRGRWLFGVAWAMVVLAVFAYFGRTHFGHVRTLQVIFSPFSLTFLTGYFLGLLHPRVRTMPLPATLTLLVLGVAGLCAGAHWTNVGGPYPENNNLSRFVGYGLPCACIVASALGLEPHLKRKIVSLSVLGNVSYAVYLTHLLIISGGYAVGRALGFHGRLASGFIAVACLAACPVVAYLFNRTVESRLTRWTRNLIEGPHRPGRVER